MCVSASIVYRNQLRQVAPSLSKFTSLGRIVVAVGRGADGLALVGQHQPQGVDHAGDAKAQTQNDVQPEVQTDTDLQECGDGRKKDGEQYLDDLLNGFLLK